MSRMDLRDYVKSTERLITMRIVAIESMCAQENGELRFDPKEKKDSEAFHELLCTIDPGDEYSVFFFTLEDTL